MGNRKTFALGLGASAVLGLTLYGLVADLGQRPLLKAGTQEFKSTVEVIGTKLITDHILAFEMVSVLLLGALVGAAVVARPHNKSTGE